MDTNGDQPIGIYLLYLGLYLIFLPRDAMRKRGTTAGVCLSVCLSIILVYCNKSSKQSHHYSFCAQAHYPVPRRTPSAAALIARG